MIEPRLESQTSAWSMYRAIVGIGAFCALVIVTVYNSTANRISENQARFLAHAISEVLPAAQATVAVDIGDSGDIVAADDQSSARAFLGYDADDVLVGAALAAEGMGYQDNIRVLYAYSFDQHAIVGFMVLDSKETPGLGDKIETEPHFIANFETLDVTVAPDGRSLLHPIVTVKQGEKTEAWHIDGITGATITSEAIGTIVNRNANTWVPLLERNLAGLGKERISRSE